MHRPAYKRYDFTSGVSRSVTLILKNVKMIKECAYT